MYTRQEVYEVLHNIIRRPANLAYVPKEIAIKAAQILPNWPFFNLEEIIKDKIDITVSPGANTISDLMVEPVSFPQGAEKYLFSHKGRYHVTHAENER